MKATLIRGVPKVLQQDGWWLSGPPPGSPPPLRTSSAPHSDLWRVALLAGLIGLADILIWQVVPGLSLAVFGAALITAGVVMLGRPLTGRQLALLAGLALLVLLPLVELVQPLSILVSFIGFSLLLALIAGLRLSQSLLGAARLWPLGIEHLFGDISRAFQSRPQDRVGGHARSLFFNWAMPLALTALFVTLLISANPVVQIWLQDLSHWQFPQIERVLFWLCVVPLGWTVLSLAGLTHRLRLPLPTPVRHFGPAAPGLVNPGSMRRALILFNILFALQTGMDLAYLYGGVGLPDGLTYAEYAHRGAYPLLVTALLAGGFALLTRRWSQSDGALQLLLMIWIGQNVALVVSSLVRLDLYVGVYGLTHLRLAAGIWMGLVALGLGLVIWQVWRGRDNGWLILRCGLLGAATLYLCCFLSFDALVARYNLTHPVPLDRAHLCQLGDAAQPVIAAHSGQSAAAFCAGTGHHRIAIPSDWREWGFRNWRARRSLALLMTEAPT